MRGVGGIFYKNVLSLFICDDTVVKLIQTLMSSSEMVSINNVIAFFFLRKNGFQNFFQRDADVDLSLCPEVFAEFFGPVVVEQRGVLRTTRLFRFTRVRNYGWR